MSTTTLDNTKIPGEIIKLPSLGLFYTNGELDENVQNGEVEVFPMGAFDEIAMRNIDHIINGTSVTEVFSRCVPQVKKPGDLFGKDVDQILLVLRRITYGPNMEISYKHTCKAAKDHQYKVNITEIINASTNLDPTTINTLYTVVMENGQVVELRPVRFRDIVTIMQNSKNFDTAPLAEIQTKLVESTIEIIHAVDGDTDKKRIKKWASRIPAPWFKKISLALDNGNNWGPNINHTLICEDCKEPMTVELPLNPLTFFLDF